MRPILSLVFAAPLLSPSMAIAAPDKPATLPSEVRLSDEEKEKVLEMADRHKIAVVGYEAGRREDGNRAVGT